MICEQCPRRCGALRKEGAAGGVCAMPLEPVVARCAPHFWEEPPISGTRGAGTVFFSGCSLRCVFCQNSVISQEGLGKAVSVVRLREMFLELAEQGCHNIDLVTPTHYAHAIALALAEPLPIPVVWNSGGYDSIETLRMLEGKVQIYLPDLKYLDPARAGRYSGAPDYPQVARAALLEMYRQVGPCVTDGEGILQRGMIIRHLLLPGGLQEAKAVMDWVSEAFPQGAVWFSLMSQYVPMGRASEYPEIDRKLRPSEARAAERYMVDLGLAGFAQDPASADGVYIPNFDLTGV